MEPRLRWTRHVANAARPMAEWSSGDSAANHSLVDRWQHFEREMQVERTKKSGPLRWSPGPNRNPDGTIIKSAFIEEALQTTPQSPNPDQDQQVMSQVRNKPPEKPPMEKDIEMSTEEGRAELANYLKMHQKEVESQRELLKRRLDRIAFQRLPKLENHIMVNPLKLFTPTKKIRFDTQETKTASTDTDSSINTSQEHPADGNIAFKQNDTNQGTLPHSGIMNEPVKKVLTKLAAWSKSLEPPPPEPPKPVSPPNVLKVITAKTDSTSPVKESYSPEPLPPTKETTPEESSPPSKLPKLVKVLQASSVLNEEKVVNSTSPYPPIPFAQRYHNPTPSSTFYIPPNNRRRIQKPPMSFESPLTSIERSTEVCTVPTPPNTLKLN